ncbi:MAG TPA: hypothetical protein VF103_13485 [Polyangiaceae bacterium]
MRLALVLLPVFFTAACGVGDGEGWVRSENLYVTDCWNGKFDLGPDFFAANPSPGSKSLSLRVQRGDDLEERSDGLTVIVNQLSRVRGMVGSDIQVGLPVGVSPPGVPVVENPDPPLVNLALYLHGTCDRQNGTVYSVDGTIHFESLYSGDPNEGDADDRLTEASFDAWFADPRELVGPASTNPSVMSQVRGHFRFFYQRGQPAQPFQ